MSRSSSRSNWCLAVLLVAAAYSAEAQEFDVFDPNDFLDPRERGATFRSDGFGVVTRGNSFTLARLYTGMIDDYQWRNKPTGERVSFAHLTASHYFSNKQVSVKLTTLDGAVPLPRYRVTTQMAFYAVPELQEGEEDPFRFAARYLVSYSIEENRTDLTAPRYQHDYNHEYGLQIDGAITRHGKTRVGSLVYIHRNAHHLGSPERVTYFYRVGEHNRGPFRLGGSVGLGGEKTRSWHWGVVRGIFTAAVDVPLLAGTFNLAYSPAYLPADGQRFHELTFFMDWTLLSRLAPSK